MIHALRRRHHHIIVALGVFLPVTFVIGIVARKPVPTVDSLPAALAVAPQPFQAVEWEHADFFTKSPIRVQLLREQQNSGSFAVKFTAVRGFAWPDLLVYWIGGNQAVVGNLPDDAILLGGFGAVPLPLPDEAGPSAGVFVLYSLADHEIVDVSRQISINDPSR